METNSLFPLKYRIRETDEPVEIVAWETADKGARSESDWVSYIDADGNKHIKEHLTLEWDFVLESPFENDILKKFVKGELPQFDPWESRRYELAKEFVTDGLADIEGAVAMADELITKLKNSPEATEFIEGVQMDDGYDNIGVGEIVEAIDGLERLKKFVFTDRKDIVGYRGDSGRWNVGDRVKVYIKRLPKRKKGQCRNPKKGLE